MDSKGTEGLTGVLLWVASTTRKNKYFPLPYNEASGAIPLVLTSSDLATIATELTAIRKQNQIRLLAGIAFTATGTPTALFTAGQAYNNVRCYVVNTDPTTAYTFDLWHENGAGSIIGKQTGNSYPLEANGATEINIGGMASGDKIFGNANNVAMWLTVKGAAE